MGGRGGGDGRVGGGDEREGDYGDERSKGGVVGR